MSKLGDVIVKLLLDSDQYEKGLSKSKKSTHDFSATLSKGFTAAIGKVTALIGVIAGIGKAFEQVSNANQAFGDKWQEFTSGLKGAWQEFGRAIATVDFSDLIGRLKEASDAARDLYNAVDAMGEIGTSFNIASAQEAKHLAELRIAMNDQTKSYEERIAAAEEWLKISEELNKMPLRGLSRVQDATITQVMTQMKFPFEKNTDEQIKYAKAQFIEFFKWLGTEAGEAAYGQMQSTNNSKDRLSGKDTKNFQNMENRGVAPGGRLWLTWLRRYADYVNDDDRQALEDAIVGFLKADAAFAETSRRVQNTLNTLRYQQANKGKSGGVAGASTEDSVEEAKIKRDELLKINEELKNVSMIETPAIIEATATEMPDLITDEWLERQRAQGEKMSAWLADLAGRCDGAARELGNAVQSGVVGAIDELANAVASGESVDGGAVVKALLSPLADACISAGLLIMTTGTAVESLRDTLISGLATGGISAIAAGAGLMAVGAAAKIGLAAIGKGQSAGSHTSSASSGSPSGPSMQTINSELTINVKGTLKGSDIVISGQRTVNSWNR